MPTNPSPCYVSITGCPDHRKGTPEGYIPNASKSVSTTKVILHILVQLHMERMYIRKTFWIYTLNVNSHHFLQYGQLNGQSQESGSVTLKSRLFRPWQVLLRKEAAKQEWHAAEVQGA